MHCPQLPRVFENIPSKTLESDLDFSRVSFVTPSNWLMNLAKSSKLLKDSSGLVISNSFYGYESHVEDHKEIGPAINVGFAAMDPKSWIKGGDIVSSLIQKTSGEGKYKFLALTDFKNYADFWSSIDVLLVPSRADNSPNVIHEAKMWGIPVVTSNIGGIPEIIDESFDSALSIDEFTIERIVFEIEKVVEKSGDKQLKKNVSQNHKAFLDMSIDKHIELYRSLLD
jgi:hypothetical protein